MGRVKQSGAGLQRLGAIAVLLVLAMTSVGIASCGGNQESTDSAASGLPDEIVIGAAIAKSGVLAPYDGSIAAVEQLVEEVNARGGVGGARLRLVQADTRSNPQQAVVAAQQVVEEGAEVMLVTCESLMGDAEAVIAEEHDILNFTLCENAPGFGPPAGSHLSFSANPSLLSEASAGALFLHRRGIERPFLFRDTAFVYGKAHCSAFEQTWEHLGSEIAGSTDIKITDELFASQVSELGRADADAVVMCSSPPGGAAAIKQIRAAGIDVPILGPSGFDGTFWMKGIHNTEDIYATSNGSIYDPPDPATGRLLRRLDRAGVDTDISTNLLSAYAAGQLIVAAIESTGSLEGDILAEELESRAHKTIVGTIKYSEDDHYPTRIWPIYRFTNGQQRLVTEVKPEFIPEYGN